MAVNHYGGCVWPIGNSLVFHWQLIQILVFTDHQPYLPNSASLLVKDFATDLGKPYELFFVFCFVVKRGGHQYWLFYPRAVLDPLPRRSITDNCGLRALLHDNVLDIVDYGSHFKNHCSIEFSQKFAWVGNFQCQLYSLCSYVTSW